MPDDYQDDNQAEELDEQDSSTEEQTETPRAKSARHAKILARVRKNYRYGLDQWQDSRDERRLDMKFVSGDPWPEKERIERRAANRPCLALDEVTQYCNQTINDVRQNKRGIKFTATGEGANDKTAELRTDAVRAYEFKSKANLARIMAFECALQGSYGFYRIGFKFSKSGKFHQELTCLPIPNPDSVVIDPDCKMPDRSDMDWGFVLDPMRKTDFKARFKNAKKVSFNADDQHLYPDWAQHQTILVAEYWEREKEIKTLYLLADDKTVYEDEYDEKTHGEIQDEREDEVVTVCQYITNGFEILEENEFPGDYIPIIMISGKEMYVEQKGSVRRVLMSLIRLARDPAMLYNYYRTCQMEIVGMVPKVPWIGAKGQFDGMEDIWASLNQVPRAYVEYNPIPDAAGGQPVPPPSRASYEPAIQALEMGAEAARRAIQAACGINPLPTAAQRQNEKSGKALDRIKQTEAQGSFHFIDNFDSAITHEGRIINAIFAKIFAGQRDLPIRKADGAHAVVRINDKTWVNPQTKQIEHHDTQTGEHDVTVSTGPSYDSQREEVNDFIGLLAQNEAIAPRVLDLLIRLKDLGPLGDQMADRVTPPEFAKPGSPQEMQGKLQQAGQQVKALDAAVQQLQGELKQAQDEKNAKIVDNQFKMAIEKYKADVKAESEIAFAEITTKAQILSERMGALSELLGKIHDSSHERAMQAEQHGHEASQADKAAVVAAQQEQPLAAQ